MDFDGHIVRMEIATALKSHEAVLKALSESLEGQNMLMNCIQPMLHETDLYVTQRRILDNICPFFGAEWGNGSEVWGTSDIDTMGRRESGKWRPGRIPSALSGEYGELFNSYTQILITDTEAMKDSDPENYEFLKQEGSHISLQLHRYLRAVNWQE